VNGPARFLMAAAALLVAAAPLTAQLSRSERCTVCKNDAKLMERNGITHGPFPFARNDSEKIAADFLWAPVWIETKHVRLAADLPTWKIPENEKKAYRAELEELQKKWPEIKPKGRSMDRWLRAHLLAERIESFYAEFEALVGREEESFWDEDKNYYAGVGPYLGMFEKYEVMIFQERELYRDFMQRTWGLTYVKPQRWNNVERRCLWFGFNMEEDDIRHDERIHNAVRHNLALNFLNGYQFYAYDLPAWLREGLAHWATRVNDERFAFFDTVEGAFVEKKSLLDWRPDVRELVLKDEATSFASLMRRHSFAELDFEDHLVVWSKVDFLIAQGAEKFGAFVTDLKSRRNAAGLPDGSGMDDAQRDAFRDHYGWNLPQVENAWKAWVVESYSAK